MYWGQRGRGGPAPAGVPAPAPQRRSAAVGLDMAAGRRSSCAASVEVLCLEFLHVNRRILSLRRCRGCAQAALCKRGT